MGGPGGKMRLRKEIGSSLRYNAKVFRSYSLGEHLILFVLTHELPQICALERQMENEIEGSRERLQTQSKATELA